MKRVSALRLLDLVDNSLYEFRILPKWAKAHDFSAILTLERISEARRVASARIRIDNFAFFYFVEYIRFQKLIECAVLVFTLCHSLPPRTPARTAASPRARRPRVGAGHQRAVPGTQAAPVQQQRGLGLAGRDGHSAISTSSGNTNTGFRRGCVTTRQASRLRLRQKTSPTSSPSHRVQPSCNVR